MENLETEIIDVIESSVSNTELDSESVVLQGDESVQILRDIHSDVRIILVVVLLTFCVGSFRQYRKNFSRGV